MKRALLLVHTAELLEQACAAMEVAGLSYTAEQGERMAEVGGLFSGPQVVIAMMQSLGRKERLRRFPRNFFDVIVVDEAHRGVCSTYRRILEHFDSANVLGLSATPDRADGVALGHVFDSVAYEYGIRRGIEEGYLSPIKARAIVCDKLDLSRVRTTKGDLKQSDLRAAVEVDGLHHQIASALVKEAGNRQTLVFTVSIEQARALCDVLGGYVGDAGRVSWVSGELPKKLRDERITAFRAGKFSSCSTAWCSPRGLMRHSALAWPFVDRRRAGRFTRKWWVVERGFSTAKPIV
ncbi:MAG: DEAD/DEAH box helicase family protein [Polyangiales bacterium]